MNRPADVIIVGGGIIGTTAALALSDLGLQVVLIEKDQTIPRRLVGELLQPAALQALDLLGFSHVLQSVDAVPTLGYKIHSHSKVQTLPFSGKHQGVTLHHDRLLVQLRKMVLESPCISFIQGTVTEIVKENQTVKGVQIDTHQETMTVNAPLTLLSDGIFSRFREEFHPQKKKTMSQFVGLLLYNVPSDYSYYGHVLDTGPTIALLYKIDPTTYRILVDAPVKIDMPVSKYLRQVLPFLPHDLQASFENALSSQKPQMMPNTILNTAAIQTPGLLMIGDAWNMRHPFTGGGMTVGLWDIVHLKHSLSQKHPIIEDALISYRFRRAFCINVLSQALYLIFASTNSILVSKSLTMIGQKERFYLKIGCLKYFELGGDCIRIPIGILSGTIESPFRLVYHFLRVVLCSIVCIILQEPFYHAVPLIAMLIWDILVTFLPIAYHDVKYAARLFRYGYDSQVYSSQYYITFQTCSLIKSIIKRCSQ